MNNKRKCETAGDGGSIVGAKSDTVTRMRPRLMAAQSCTRKMRFAQARMNARAVLALMLTTLAKQSRASSRRACAHLEFGLRVIPHRHRCPWPGPAPRRKATDSEI